MGALSSEAGGVCASAVKDFRRNTFVRLVSVFLTHYHLLPTLHKNTTTSYLRTVRRAPKQPAR